MPPSKRKDLPDAEVDDDGAGKAITKAGGEVTPENIPRLHCQADTQALRSRINLGLSTKLRREMMLKGNKSIRGRLVAK